MSSSLEANLAKFENEQYKNGIASGEFLVVQGYNGDIAQVMQENADTPCPPMMASYPRRDGDPYDASEVALASTSCTILPWRRNITFTFFHRPM